MSTIRDMNNGRIVDVHDEGRRVTLTYDATVESDFECCISDSSVCEGHGDESEEISASVTFDKAELLALLGAK